MPIPNMNEMHMNAMNASRGNETGHPPGCNGNNVAGFIARAMRCARAHYLVLVLLTSAMPLLAASVAHAECTATSSATAGHLIELYTSEGCSSCPPADAWLRKLPQRDGLVALAFHVDYWDSLGWRDRFADPRFTQRQQALAARGESGISYTPEVALDGREWRSWSSGRLPTSRGETAPTLTLHVTPGDPLTARVELDMQGADVSDFEIFVALSENGLSSQVRAGENRGKLLLHDHVVRAFAGPAKPAGEPVPLYVPANLKPTNTAVVAFAQNRDDGRIAQVVQLPFAACKK